MLLDVLKGFDPAILRVDLTRHDRLDRALYKLERMSEGLESAEIGASAEVIKESKQALQANVLPRRKTAKLLAMGGLVRLQEETGSLGLIERFLKLVDQAGSAVLLRCLLIGYLRFADADGGLPSLLRQYLKGRRDKLPRQWLRRVDEYDLLGEKIGAKFVDLVLGDREQPPRELLADAGLKGVLEASGFSRSVFREVTRSLAKNPTDQKLHRFFSWVEVDGGKRILFENSIKEYCDALLSPYLHSDPTGESRPLIHNFLIENFGDPRLEVQEWNPVPDDQKAVINRWLTEESFELLLQIVNRSNDTDHWRSRKKFWGEYIEKGLISEAWVALGTRAAEVARMMQRSGDLASSAVYGLLMKENIDPFHSVIFMRIGNWIISEWTHSGKVRFYSMQTNENTPKLYQRWYRPDIIRNDYKANMAFVHNGNWQSNVRSYLRTKIKVNRTVPDAVPQPSQPVNRKTCVLCNKSVFANECDAHGRCASCRGVKAKFR